MLLLKWAADTDLYPLEWRMLSAGGLGAVLLVLGYRLQNTRAAFGTPLQGGGIAALYLTTFFAFKTYGLLPGAVAFSQLAGVSLLSCALSATQNSMPLAVIGTIGGFSAPVLASTGQGSHVLLFSYYLLLNGVVLTLSVLKSWRPVRAVGALSEGG